MSFTAETWAQTPVFTGRVATPEDVTAGRAVFALADTHSPETLDLGEPLPQPAIWYDDDAQTAVVVVQAEAHATPEGQALEPLGLVLADGRTVVGFLDEIDLVADADPIWRALVEDALFAQPPILKGDDR